jgi:RES domain-containing protein
MVWRILRRPYADDPFNGEGSYRYGGRWSSPGTRLAYSSQNLSLAMLEYFVHIDRRNAPADLVVVSAVVPDEVSRITVSPNQLQAGWRSTPAPEGLTAHGDEFITNGLACVLIVPSAINPRESNWLIHPLHPDFKKIRIGEAEPFAYDSRLLSKLN